MKYTRYLDKSNPIDQEILKLVKEGEMKVGFVLLGR